MKIGAAMHSAWWGPGLVLVMVLVAAAVGLCVFDGHDHEGHGPSLDLCIVVLDVSFASALLAGLLLEGWAVDSAGIFVRSAWTSGLAPPPRSL